MKKFKKIIYLILSLTLLISCNSIKISNEEKVYLLENNGNEKYYLINYINQNQDKLGKLPAVMINGSFIIYCDRENKQTMKLKKEEITKIEIMTIEKSVPIFGSAGKNGIVKINTY